MDTKLFKKVNEVLAARFGLSMIINILLVIVIAIQALYISNKEEIIIERPMFSMDREMVYTRNTATRSVAEVWAYNSVMLFGNVTKENINFLQAVAYSFLDSEISAKLDVSHKDLVRFMANNSVSVRFIPNGTMDFNEETGVVTVRGVRIIESLLNKEQTPKRDVYEYQVGITMSGFRPWVSFWKEGVVGEYK